MTAPTPGYDQIVAPIETQMIRSIWQIVRNQQDAEDAMQNALITIWKRWDRIRQHPNPQALVLKLCIDAAYDQYRRRLRYHRDNREPLESADIVDPSPSPSESAETAEQHRELITVIAEMPRQQASAVLLRIIHGQSYAAIATALGCAEATARTHVARGRERLRAALSRFLHREAEANEPS